jgi:hypothetical protein
VVFHGIEMVVPMSSLRRSEVWLCDAMVGSEDGHALQGGENRYGKDSACYVRKDGHNAVLHLSLLSACETPPPTM